MTQATKTLAVLFVLSWGVAVVVAWTTGTTASESLSGPVLSFEPGLVDRITIQNREVGRVTLEKEGAGWLVSGDASNERYETEPNAVENALQRIEHLSAQSLLTRNPEQHIRYQVDDSTGTVVDLYSDDTQIAGIVLGRTGRAGTYVRPQSQNEVYAVNGYITGQFNKDVEAWRNKTVWEISREEIREVRFDYPADSSFSIVRGDESQWTTATGDSLQSGATNRLLNALIRLRARGFPDEAETATADTARYRITLTLDSGEQWSLSLNEKEGAEGFIARADRFPYPFTLGASFRNSVLKSREDLMATL